jgi:hypothetical protein
MREPDEMICETSYWCQVSRVILHDTVLTNESSYWVTPYHCGCTPLSAPKPWLMTTNFRMVVTPIARKTVDCFAWQELSAHTSSVLIYTCTVYYSMYRVEICFISNNTVLLLKSRAIRKWGTPLQLRTTSAWNHKYNSIPLENQGQSNIGISGYRLFQRSQSILTLVWDYNNDDIELWAHFWAWRFPVCIMLTTVQ